MTPGSAALPRRAVRWAQRATGGRVVAAEPVAGATTVEVHRLEVERPEGRQRVVIRRYAVATYLAEWPGRPAHEAGVLDLLSPTPVPAPGLIALDATGSECDVPAVLMTAVPGRVDRTVSATVRGCEAMASVLAYLHDLAAETGRDYRPYSAGVVVPSWANAPGAWRTAISVVPDPSPAVLIHRDFHPGNVLWSGDALAGVVDWGEACTGPAGVDVAHCRVNLALWDGPVAAQRLLDAYEALTAMRYDRRWDVRAVLDFLPHDRGRSAVDRWPADGSPPGSRHRLEGFLGAALEAL